MQGSFFYFCLLDFFKLHKKKTARGPCSHYRSYQRARSKVLAAQSIVPDVAYLPAIAQAHKKRDDQKKSKNQYVHAINLARIER